ncbi:MAG: hypothetical protein IT371_12430 [Deltaproteobacteria bacterium]|nr:hypothetical protein [Deltaproteobacteria bacterium]
MTSALQVFLHGKRVQLKDQDLLGAGGEARVYRHRDLALKIFHPVDPAAPADEQARQRALLELKREKLCRFPRGLPASVVAPSALLQDKSGTVVGYAMRAVEGADELRRLAQRSFRDGLVPTQRVVGLFRQLFLALAELHARRVVVGDLNDGNALFRGDEVAIIDADSMQFEGLPCVVGHERFLDPRLYGVDLAAGPAFTEESDWYAFDVLLFASLLYLHPYGGTLDGYPTPLRRAEARMSVLRPKVTLPKAAASPTVLPDDVLGHFEAVFDRDARGAFPPRLLEMRWTRCSCGLEHARPACPACAKLGKVVAQPVLRRHGRCEARTVLRTRGRILAAALQGTLRTLVLEGEEVRREDGSRVFQGLVTPELAFGLAGRSTWIGRGTELVRVEDERVVERVRTDTRLGRPVFATSQRGVLRLEDGWLVDGATTRRMGQLLEGQSALWAGEALGCAAYRAGLLTLWFVFELDRPGLRPIALPQVRGRLLDASVVLGERELVVARAVEEQGRVRHEVYLVDARGGVLGVRQGAPEEARLLASLTGKALQGGRLVCATEEGLLSVTLDRQSGLLLDGALFPDTRPFVEEGAALLPAPGGAVYVVTAREITQLTLV